MRNHVKLFETTADGSFEWEMQVYPTPDYVPGSIPADQCASASRIGNLHGEYFRGRLGCALPEKQSRNS